MKRYLVISILVSIPAFALFLNPVFGQNRIEIGPRFGANVSTLGDNGGEYTTKVGWHAGLYVNKRFFQEVALQAEVIISAQGARHRDISDLKLNYTYLAVPVLAKFYPQPSFSVAGGIRPAYLVSARQLDAGSAYSIVSQVREIDISGVLGITYGKKFGHLGLRYVVGLINTSNGSVASEIKYRNQVVQLYIALPLVVKP